MSEGLRVEIHRNVMTFAEVFHYEPFNSKDLIF